MSRASKPGVKSLDLSWCVANDDINEVLEARTAWSLRRWCEAQLFAMDYDTDADLFEIMVAEHVKEIIADNAMLRFVKWKSDLL